MLTLARTSPATGTTAHTCTERADRLTAVTATWRRLTKI